MKNLLLIAVSIVVVGCNEGAGQASSAEATYKPMLSEWTADDGSISFDLSGADPAIPSFVNVVYGNGLSCLCRAAIDPTSETSGRVTFGGCTRNPSPVPDACITNFRINYDLLDTGMLGCYDDSGLCLGFH